jgi:hypothetical protein
MNVFRSRRHRWLAFLCLAGLARAAHAQPDTTRFETKVLPVLASHCFQCHGDKVQTAGVNLALPSQTPELWSKVRDKVKNRLMPPPPLPGLS